MSHTHRLLSSLKYGIATTRVETSFRSGSAPESIGAIFMPAFWRESVNIIPARGISRLVYGKVSPPATRVGFETPSGVAVLNANRRGFHDQNYLSSYCYPITPTDRTGWRALCVARRVSAAIRSPIMRPHTPRHIAWPKRRRDDRRLGAPDRQRKRRLCPRINDPCGHHHARPIPRARYAGFARYTGATDRLITSPPIKIKKQ